MDVLIDETNTIKLNVGGTIFQCHPDTLLAYPDTKLARLKFTDGRAWFFDRDPRLFGCILDAYRKREIHVSRDICGETFRKELEYWELSGEHVAPCCWKTLYSSEEDMESMHMLLRTCTETKKANRNQRSGPREKVWQTLEEPCSSRCAFVWGMFISLVVVTSILVECLQSLPQFWGKHSLEEKRVIHEMVELFGYSNKTLNAFVSTKVIPVLYHLDFACNCILSLEFILLFIVCPHKKKFLSSLLRVILLVGYISASVFYAMHFYITQLRSVYLMWLYVILQYLSVLKIFRLIYVTRHVPAFTVFGLTFSTSKNELKIFMFMFSLLVCLFGFAMYLAELTHNVDISNIPSSMYWALITLTTVGYGDYTPVTPAGQVVASLCAVCGVLVMTMPIGVIASTFYSFYTCGKYMWKHTSRYKVKL